MQDSIVSTHENVSFLADSTIITLE